MTADRQVKEKQREMISVMDDDILLHEILHGESKKIELKMTLPSDSKKYIKRLLPFPIQLVGNY
jgi:hypothetical protein